MFELIAIRHGQTDWNIRGQKRVMGRRPIPLNRTGRQQARIAARSLKDAPIAAVYVSPILRAIQTAHILLRGRRGVPCIEEEGVVEINYGAWENRLHTEFARTPEWEAYWWHGASAQIPGGERVADVQTRAVAAVERARAAHPDRPVVFVSHSDVIKALMAHYLQISLDHWQRFKIDNGAISVVRFEADMPRVWRLNSDGY